MSEAIIGLIGVVVGSLITGVPTWLLAKANRRDKYKLAIYDKRIQAHQEAYALSWDLSKSLGQSNILNIQNDCHKWWIHNRLYLTKGAAKAFKKAYQEAHCFHKEEKKEPVRGQKEENKRVLRLIEEADKAILQDIDLEYLGGLEKKGLRRKS